MCMSAPAGELPPQHLRTEREGGGGDTALQGPAPHEKDRVRLCQRLEENTERGNDEEN